MRLNLTDVVHLICLRIMVNTSLNLQREHQDFVCFFKI